MAALPGSILDKTTAEFGARCIGGGDHILFAIQGNTAKTDHMKCQKCGQMFYRFETVTWQRVPFLTGETTNGNR